MKSVRVIPRWPSITVAGCPSWSKCIINSRCTSLAKVCLFASLRFLLEPGSEPFGLEPPLKLADLRDALQSSLNHLVVVTSFFFFFFCTLGSHSVMSNSLCPYELLPPRLLCPWDFSGKNTGMGYHFLLQRIIPTQKSNPCFLLLLNWQADSLPLHHLGSPKFLEKEQISEPWMKDKPRLISCLITQSTGALRKVGSPGVLPTTSGPGQGHSLGRM